MIDEDPTRQLEVRLVPLSHPVPASALDSHLVGTITHHTTPIYMLMSGNHQTIQFHVLKSPNLPLILGHPCLRRHNPHIDWVTGSILEWSPTCQQVCRRPDVVPQPPTCSRSTSNLSKGPAEYQDFRKVFSKARPTSLPPHLPYDCAIDHPWEAWCQASVPGVSSRKRSHGDLDHRHLCSRDYPSLFVPRQSGVFLCGRKRMIP